MSDIPGPPPFPRATYRLQFNSGFRFGDGRKIIPYLAALGVSHVYASPIFMARPGSTHGYDTVDHNRFNPEIGEMEEFEAFVGDLHEHGMGLILDFVPNHMGVGPDNPWWVDVLEWGRKSPYESYFDIDWQGAEPALGGKVVLPVLGDHYGSVLERGELKIRFDRSAGAFSVSYYESSFPIAPRAYRGLLTKAAQRSLEVARFLAPVLENPGTAFSAGRHRLGRATLRDRMAAFKRDIARVALEQDSVIEAIEDSLVVLNGQAGHPESFDALHRLLEQQAYRLAYWRVASHEINYRRFFDINELAGLRMENPDLFDACHGLVRNLIERNMIQGIRLDHIDGLRDPEAYLKRLRAMTRSAMAKRAGKSRRSRRPGGASTPDFWILVEKILAPHESLRREWAVEGSTGYDFMTQVNEVFVDPRGERPLTRLYERFKENQDSFEDIVQDAKHLIMRESLASEVSVVAHALHRLAKQNRNTRDYSLIAFREALIRLVAHFPVYRTYVTSRGVSAEDRRDIDWAIGKARKTPRLPDTSIYDFLRDILTLDILKTAPRGYRRRDVLDVVTRLQQYTGPVMAKSMEDTAFYRYVRLVSLNEVGGEPTRFGSSPGVFHKANLRRVKEQPFSMLATATHDHKRGEDVRARLGVLSEIPREWGRKVLRWSRLNARKKTDVHGRGAPSANDEFLFYQIVVGAWPYEIEAPDFYGFDDFRDRIRNYMQKAMRESKSATSWSAPDEDYEGAVNHFMSRVLDLGQNRPFLDDVAAFVSQISPAGAVNGLAQTVLKLTSPGVPDFYQGSETWDLSLVDPDNRRPVDYDTLQRYLDGDTGDDDSMDCLKSWRDGRIKQHVIRRLLVFRRQNPELFFAGSYEPIAVSGPRADHVIAFARRYGRQTLVVVVPRLVHAMIPDDGLPRPDGWGNTSLDLDTTGHSAENLFSGRIETDMPDRNPKVSEILRSLPVAVFSLVGD